MELDGLRRSCPALRLVVSTRRQMLDVPRSGPRVAIEPLSEDQQMAIARASFGAAGEAAVDEAWRTPGVWELIAIPLHLSALLSVRSRKAAAVTKEEVLRLFVEQHEQGDDHAEALHAALLGCRADVLTALASHLNAIGSTAMAEAEVRRIVAAAIARLREDGQIAGQPEPASILDVLASHHVLTRSGSAIAFQHQQLQEWFASHEVANLMRESASGDGGARDRLRASVLDRPPWEESIRFAAERVSREQGGGAGVVAHATRLALSIDPMLAAEMIYRSSAAVWEDVTAEVLAFMDRWHRPGKVDRAVRFMIMTGRPEFAPRTWPLAAATTIRSSCRHCALPHGSGRRFSGLIFGLRLRRFPKRHASICLLSWHTKAAWMGWTGR